MRKFEESSIVRIRKYFKSNLTQLLESRGILVERAVTETTLDPYFDSNALAAIQYCVPLARHRTRCSIHHGTSSRGFRLGRNSADPFVVCIRESLRYIDDLNALRQSVIQRLSSMSFYSPDMTFAEAMNLDAGDLPRHYDFPAWTAVLPWDTETPEEREKTFPDAVRSNRKEHGINLKHESPREIMRANFDSFAWSHGNQLADLAHSIHRTGWHPTPIRSLPKIQLLDRLGDFRWKMGDEGNHRVSVASALGSDDIEVCVERVVSQAHAPIWPNVVNGVYSIDGALKVFDHYFDGI